MRQGGDSYLAYNGPFVVNAQITQSPSQGLCGQNSAPLTCFRPTEMGYPDGFTSPANFSTATTKTVLHRQDHPHALRAELALHHPARTGEGPRARSRLRRQSQRRALGERRSEPGACRIGGQESAGEGAAAQRAIRLHRRQLRRGLLFLSRAAGEAREALRPGAYLLNSFTWSKAIDNASGALEAGNGDQQAVNLFDSRSSKGLSGYDQPFNNTTSRGLGPALRPWPPLRRQNAVVLDALLGGWTLSGINTMASGQTINLTYDPNAAFIATDGSKNSAIYRPNIIGDPMMPSGPAIDHAVLQSRPPSWCPPM